MISTQLFVHTRTVQHTQTFAATKISATEKRYHLMVSGWEGRRTSQLLVAAAVHRLFSVIQLVLFITYKLVAVHEGTLL